MTLYLITPIFTDMYNLTLQPVLSSALHWEPLSTILAFSVNDPLPDLPNFPGSG